MVSAQPDLAFNDVHPATGAEHPRAGLTTDLARERLEEVGLNDPFPVVPKSGLRQLLPLVANPLAGILLCASVVSAAVGETASSITIATIVLVGAAINFIQTRRSQVIMDELRSGVAPSACVLRDGKWTDIDRREVVPGDLIRLAAGDIVPADAGLLEAKDLHVQEAALTGESLPVEKSASAEADTTDTSGRVYLGSSIVSGTAVAEAYATGARTMFGDVAARLRERPPETEFDRGTKRFGLFIMRTVFVLVIFAFFVNTARGHDAIQSLLFGVALAVGLTPEFLPMITAVTLARGAVRLARRHVIVKHLAAIQNFGSIDVLCSDKTGTLTCGEMKLERSVDAQGAPNARVLMLAALNSRHETGIANPLDAAVLAALPEAPTDYTKIDEIPFDFERRSVSVVLAHEGSRMLVCKGSPEFVLEACAFVEVSGTASPMDAVLRATCVATYRKLCADGLRVLAVAVATPETKAAYTRTDEQLLTLVGFLSFLDPPRADTKDAIADLRRDGVRVKILTGDDDLVTHHVCDQVGIDAERIVLGVEVERMSDGALAHIAETVDVFARVSPAQKNRIIIALKNRSHVVGFLGDGINDTPSLRAADVGISVSSAVDVAKEAAEIVLLVPGLRVLHSGIIEGRKAFGNVMKYLLMGTSSNFGNMFSMAGASLFLPFLPMLPAQILLNSFLYDLAQIAIPTDHVDASFIQKPHRWDISLIRNFMLLIGPISSLYDFATFWILIHVFHASEAAFHTGWFVESLATQTLVLFVIRTAKSPFRSRPSLALVCAVLLVVSIGILLPFSPLATGLGFVALPGTFFLFLVGATLTYLLVVELGKRRLTGHLLEGGV
jgi:Mg2+-importing ATPase